MQNLCKSAKRRCISRSDLSCQRAFLRVRPAYASRGPRRDSEKEHDPQTGDRGKTAWKKAASDDLRGAEEGSVNFDRAEAELRRRLTLVGWQYRKGNAYKDKTVVICRGGQGGDGAVSFMHCPFSPDNTPPDGAGGGRGGNVYVRVSDQRLGLAHIPARATAGQGGRGRGDHRAGERGQDVILEVPVGTLIKERRLPGDWPSEMPDSQDPPAESDFEAYAEWEAARRERIFTYHPGLQGDRRMATPEDERFFRAEAEVLMHERLLRRSELDRDPIDVDLVEQTGDALLVAVGGQGGKGNMSFVGGYCRLPRFGTKGMAGQKVVLEMELKSLADVGLVGFPNAGKSTLLRAMSESKAEVASYPFTTLRPHLGTVIVYDDGSFGEGRTGAIEETTSPAARHGPHTNPAQLDEKEMGTGPMTRAAERVEAFRMRVADCPGILPDASKNEGLGRDFLRHVERSPVLAYVIDLSVTDPVRTLRTLRDELESYQAGLSDRAKVIVANKADRCGSREEAADRLAALGDVVPGLPILPTSARYRHNVARLVRTLRLHVEESRKQSDEDEPNRRAEREARLELEVDRTVRRIGVFRRAGGIDYLQHATPSDREVAQQVYDTSFRRAKIDESRWLAESGARRALAAEQEAEIKRLEWEEERLRRQEL